MNTNYRSCISVPYLEDFGRMQFSPENYHYHFSDLQHTTFYAMVLPQKERERESQLALIG